MLQRPENLVDRKIDGQRAEWASESLSASLELRWQLPIRAREVVLYGTAPGQGSLGARNQTIRAVTLVILLGKNRLEERAVTGGLSPSGTHVALDTSHPFDRLQVIIREEDVDGLYEGSRGPALAEVEVIARAAESAGPLSFVRGDSDCDNEIQISDAIRILDWLFRGAAAVCCTAAADAIADDRIDLSDPVYLLNYLFLGGSEPAPPFPDCGTSPATSLSCDGPTECGGG